MSAVLLDQPGYRAAAAGGHGPRILGDVSGLQDRAPVAVRAETQA